MDVVYAKMLVFTRGVGVLQGRLNTPVTAQLNAKFNASKGCKAVSGATATPGHVRQVNLMVFDPKTGKTLQAVSANCSS